jgi:dienelactone hydrolase
MLSVTMEILDQIEKEYLIDTHRVTLIGISSGASACWELLRRHGDRFAAAAALGGGGAADNSIVSQIKTPVWAFHAEADPEMSADGAVRTIAALKAAGGKASLTMTKDDRHDCWTKAFGSHDLLFWLLAQRIGDSSPPPPGHYRLNVRLALFFDENWPRLGLIGAVAVLAITCHRYLKRCSRVREAAQFREGQMKR